MTTMPCQPRSTRDANAPSTNAITRMEASSHPREGISYCLGESLTRATQAQPYERIQEDPLYRPLYIYTLDPSESRLDGAVALVKTPYEPLQPGPIGTLIEVDDYDELTKLRYQRVNLEDPKILIKNGCMPSPSDHEFHQQMTYAVCCLTYAAFQRALGRNLAWGFSRTSTNNASARLLVRPHAFQSENAYYDKNAGALCFGYYRAHDQVLGRNLPHGYVFTCLSHDIVVHEVTHALLDGLRSQFTFPSSIDVLAFHEAFADLIAIFQHFSYDQVVLSALQKAQGHLEQATLLTDIARQFGYTIGAGGPLRTSIDAPSENVKPPQYDAVKGEPHQLGSVLVSAVFEAFLTVFRRKIEPYVRLVVNSTGLLPNRDIPEALLPLLAETASKLAAQFRDMCIRAIDYCPPINLQFGEFLRAVITADYDLVPDDPWCYREAWLDAFRKRGIYPSDVDYLSEDALLWKPPTKPLPAIPELSFADLRFEGNPGQPVSAQELRRQARVLGAQLTQSAWLEEFGCARPDDPRLHGDQVDPPSIESMRTAHRVGPHGQIVYDLVVEVTQRRRVRSADGQTMFDFYGGATVLFDPCGRVRYVICKRVTNPQRLQQQQDFMASMVGHQFWMTEYGVCKPHPQLMQRLHIRAEPLQ